jgi:GNAT superfamily N-acetyltransferase
LREITGSEPIVETVHCSSFNHYVLATYGAGKYAVISRFSMNQLPGCCGVIVFYHASVALDFRGRGLGSLLLRLREEAARKAGFTLALATVEGNEEERSILEKAGWKQLESFNDHRTGNQVILYGRLLF